MRRFLVLVVFIIILSRLIYTEAAEDMPVIVSPTNANDIGSMELEVYECHKKIYGYVVFRDKNGVMCSIKTASWHAEVSVPGDDGGYIKKVRLIPSKFQWIETKYGDKLWAYVLEPFFADYELTEKVDPKVIFKLILTRWKDSDRAHEVDHIPFEYEKKNTE